MVYQITNKTACARDIIDVTQEEDVISDEVVEESIEEPDEDEGTIENSIDPLMRYIIRLRKKRAEADDEHRRAQT